MQDYMKSAKIMEYLGLFASQLQTGQMVIKTKDGIILVQLFQRRMLNMF